MWRKVLGADEAGVEGAGEGDVSRALDEAAAVGEEGEGVGWVLEAQEEIVETDGAVRGETSAHGGEVDGTVVLVDLDGVAAAEGDMRAAFSGQVREDSLAADGACGIGGGGVDLASLVRPKIVREEGAAHEVGLVGEELEGFGGLEGGGEVDGGGEDAGSVAGFDGTCGWLGEDARKTGGGKGGCQLSVLSCQLTGHLREDVHGGGVGAYGGGVDPGFGLLDGVVVEEVAGFEVVGRVQNQIDGDEIGWGEELVDVGGHEVGDLRVDLDGGVEESDFASGGFGFREGFAGVGLVEEDLALEVRGLDEVAVDEGEGSDTGAGEEGGGGGSGGSDSDDGYVRGGEELLAGGSYPGKEDLAGVAVLIGDEARGGRGVDLGAGGWLLTGVGDNVDGVLGHGQGDSAKKALLFRSIGKGPMCREPVDMPAAFGILERNRPVGVFRLWMLVVGLRMVQEFVRALLSQLKSHTWIMAEQE
jgi:hypothetical protein